MELLKRGDFLETVLSSKKYSDQIVREVIGNISSNFENEESRDLGLSSSEEMS